MIKILILGSRGFIGSNLVNLFDCKLCETIVLTREGFYDNDNLKSILEYSDVVINCIGSANVGFSYKNATEDFQSNVGVVRIILEMLRQRELNHIKFINLSSAAVYGNPKHLPIAEIDSTEPLSPYGFHKSIAEILLKEYSQCFSLKTLSLRIFSAYGNGQRKLLLWDLHQKIQKTKGEIILFGTGNESRDFIHVEDIAQQILLAIDCANFNGDALNVANGKEIHISEIVELYQKYYPKKFNYQFNGEVRLGDPLNWCADISKMRNLGYQQSVFLEQGIDNYIKYLLGE